MASALPGGADVAANLVLFKGAVASVLEPDARLLQAYALETRQECPFGGNSGGAPEACFSGIHGDLRCKKPVNLSHGLFLLYLKTPVMDWGLISSV